MGSPFEVLGIDPDADEAEIKRAYRRRVKEAHPDQGGSAREFRRVLEAREELAARGLGDRTPTPREGRTPRDRSGEGAAHRYAESRGRDPADGDDEPRGTRARVEYLNYEVLADHGWSLDDDDLFEKTAAADLDPSDRGRFLVEPHESLLEAAENRGFAWPYACRGGACANCAVAVESGDLSMPVNHILPPEMLDRGFRLSCNGMPTTDEMRVVYNVKHLPGLDELRLPPYPFDLAHADD